MPELPVPNAPTTPTALPDETEALRILAVICDPASPLTATTKVAELGLDSLDILEWMYELGIETDAVLDEAAFLDAIETITVGELYAIFRAASAAEVGQLASA